MEYMLNPTLIMLVPALNVLGLYLKGKGVIDGRGITTYPKQKVKPKYLPMILFCVAVVFCIVNNFCTLDFEGWRLVAQSLSTGLTQGLICTGVSVFGYDLVKGLKK